MRIQGLQSILIAAGLALAGPGIAAAQTAAPANTVAPAAATPAAKTPAAPAATAAAAPAGATVATPTTASAPSTAAPDSPLLSMDGAPPMLPTAHIGQPTDGVLGLQTQVTPNGHRAEWMHDDILIWLITGICVLVLVLLGYVVFRFRAGANPTPSRTSHNTLIEVLWTVIPVLILVAIAVPSIGLLEAQFRPPPNNAVTLKAIGNQWYWSYEYPDNGDVQITANMLKEKDQVQPGERFRTDADGPRLLAADNRVVLPVGVPIRLLTTSNDVIHSWAMPAFWIKLDAVPGRLNETSFTIQRPGVYFGQCSELCGARHAFMPIVVEAVPPAEFAAWIRAKGGTMKPAGQPSTAMPAQPGADSADATSQPLTNTVPSSPSELQNVTSTPTTSSQAHGGNGAGTGNAGI